jgi:hypothetical protein
LRRRREEEEGRSFEFVEGLALLFFWRGIVHIVDFGDGVGVGVGS